VDTHYILTDTTDISVRQMSVKSVYVSVIESFYVHRIMAIKYIYIKKQKNKTKHPQHCCYNSYCGYI